MRVADEIALTLWKLEYRKLYMVTGGASMHLNDALTKVFAKNTVFLHHEQSCTMAAESYARISGKPAVVNVTAGPGSINAINGVFGAYVDSIPMIVISGQAKTETLTTSYPNLNLRQLGDQEVDIIYMVKKICKKAIQLTDLHNIRETIHECHQEAISGRPGPVWIDVPIDIQSKPVEKTEEPINLRNNNRSEEQIRDGETNTEIEDNILSQLADKLITTNRPVLYLGNGIRISESYGDLLNFLDEWPMAAVTSWNSNDLLWDSHPSNCGRAGTVGNRSGNFATQYSECILILGARMNIRQVGYNWTSFGKNAWKAHVDIDKAELDKPTLKTDMKINTNLKGFLPKLSKKIKARARKKGIDIASCKAHWQEWITWNKENLKRFSYDHCILENKQNRINPYRIINLLSKKIEEDSIIVCADGTACVAGFQAFEIKRGQRLFHNSGCASMGYELPAIIGAFEASKNEIYCLAGDGSIMMNVQELAYIGGNKVPAKIVLLNNQGYHSIRQTQVNYFPGNIVGCGMDSGLPFPDFRVLSKGFGIEYLMLEKPQDASKMIDLLISSVGPIILEVLIDQDQEFAPKVSSKKLPDGSMVSTELEDMKPFLADNEKKAIRSSARSITQE